MPIFSRPRAAHRARPSRSTTAAATFAFASFAAAVSASLAAPAFAQSAARPAQSAQPATPASAAVPASKPPATIARKAPITVPIAPFTVTNTTGIGRIKDDPPAADGKSARGFTVDTTSQNTPDHNLLFLTAVPDPATAPEQFTRYIADAAIRAEMLNDPVLSRMIRITLAQLEATPSRSREIQRQHLRRMGNHFYKRAEIAAQTIHPDTRETKTPDVQSALTAVQIAIHCAPEHVRARTLFATMLEGFQQTEAALDCLWRGQHHVKNEDPDARPFHALYLALLEKTGRDEAVLQHARRLLAPPPAGAPPQPPEYLQFLTQKAAAAAANLGRHAEAVALFRATPPVTLTARLVEAAALFDSGDTATAIRRLYAASPHLRGADRNILLQQIAIRYAELGQWANALTVAKQRAAEFPASIEARVQHYWLLLKNGKTDDAQREVTALLARHPDNTSMLLIIADIACKRGDPALVERCRHARAKSATGLAEAASNPAASKEPTAFDYLRAEASIRARRPREALDILRERRLDQPEQIRRNPAALPLRAAAYHLLGDAESARRNIESYLIEQPDEAAQARIRSLQNLLAPPPNPDGTAAPATTLTPEKIRACLDEIQRLSAPRRKIPPDTAISVARLLTRCGDKLDALRVLEQSVAAGREVTPATVAHTPPVENSQLLAEYIAARIAARATAAAAGRPPLHKDIERLLTLRRPDPRVWTPISQWLSTPEARANPAAAALHPRILPLLRPHLAPVE